MKRYKLVKAVGHPLANKNGRILEHRKVWFDFYGDLPDGHVVHHINGDRHDNRIENLQAMSRSDHMKEHYKEGLGLRNGEREYEQLTCVVCKVSFIRKAHINRANDKMHKAKHRACSHHCAGRLVHAFVMGTVDQLIGASSGTEANDRALIGGNHGL